MTGIDDRLAGGAAQVTAELPGQLPGALYRAARGASAGLAGEQGETAVQVGAAATLYVTFAEQRRYVASQFAKAEGLARSSRWAMRGWVGNSAIAWPWALNAPLAYSAPSRPSSSRAWA